MSHALQHPPLALPEELCTMNNLKNLDISDNAIRTIPESIGGMKNLMKITASNNQLSCLPASVSAIEGLQNINLNGNRLTSLPGDIHRLKNLKEISLGGNPMINPPRLVCEGKVLYPIGRYLQAADLVEDRILLKIFKLVSRNVFIEDFAFFCKKLKLNDEDTKVIVKNRSLQFPEKILQVLNLWRAQRQADMSPATITEQLIRVLVMADLHEVALKTRMLKLSVKSIKI
ncbi:leucine-rich repeat and death domain-containing protein 1 isoform X3 [Rhinoderma darwinii]|uniref:leucine-rich repeat and death domain-containing protein 1 isoform X3 n=1 Tax=Rhinoderma darwinii TaxID=43563 RepID=UPI003F679261